MEQLFYGFKIRKKNLLLIFLLFLALIWLVLLVTALRPKSVFNKNASTSLPKKLEKTDEIRLIVDLNFLNQKREVLLKVSNIPSGTEEVEYQLSYETKDKGIQGVIGSITDGLDKGFFEKKITLGTCSSGVCVYHQVSGEISVTIRALGVYGEKIFEKKFKE